jgi:hypothetical protein
MISARAKTWTISYTVGDQPLRVLSELRALTLAS